MCNALVIVESPAKAKTIKKYLGKNYIVKYSMGHIYDLTVSKKNKPNIKNNIIKNIGIDPYNEWKADYQILPGKEKILYDLQHLASQATHIYLATDRDREGEAIAWHLRQLIGGNDEQFSRITFNEITKNSIIKAFQQPKKININLVNAQQTRRFMDRIVGYMLSPLLWKKVARGLSAGRVQSLAVKILVEREIKIRNFIPKEYYELDVRLLTNKDEDLVMKITHKDNLPLKEISYENIQIIKSKIEKSVFKVIDYNYEFVKITPPKPFITSTLQQISSNKLHYSVKKTMMLAQKLYELGYITYIRTDSTSLSNDSIIMARKFIQDKFSLQYLSEVPNIFINKNSQEAHEAIRPSKIGSDEFKNFNNIEKDAQQLYVLIRNQFIASQMSESEYKINTIKVIAGHYKFTTQVKILYFDGWLKIISDTDNHKLIHNIPRLQVGDLLKLKKIFISQHFTKFPSRFSESSLINKLEKLGIGRPSTYASIISMIQNRGYVNFYNKKFYITKIAEIVTNYLNKNFRDLMDYNFTAKMENDLDQISTNTVDWKITLEKFFLHFSAKLKQAEEDGMHINKTVLTSINCSKCNRNMVIRTSITGVFLSCSGYSVSPKKICKQTINLIPLNEVDKINYLQNRKNCNICHTFMDSYIINDTKKLNVCRNNPFCKEYNIEEGNFINYLKNNKIILCKQCNSKMQFKIGRFGKYIECVKYECNNKRKIIKNNDIAPKKYDPIPFPELKCQKSNAYFILRNGLSGIFLAAHDFPKSRETRTPLIEELKFFKNRLPEKLKYLSEAPTSDPEGNQTILCFNHKTKQQYISSKKAGKKTKWQSIFINGKWIENK